ncbi:proline-rich receptor-like protein kinase PERK8 [Iris pallida]|uniref:Proline-rich receptor-like protein kinase PERK8 n=1 Tax=Iris pallida TaxID=29817 RepID=A0AAX6EVV4_IRIPA|nr:proline-rich receptor-like protein kinase PERK8 [Iris pallida]
MGRRLWSTRSGRWVAVFRRKGPKTLRSKGPRESDAHGEAAGSEARWRRRCRGCARLRVPWMAELTVRRDGRSRSGSRRCAGRGRPATR